MCLVAVGIASTVSKEQVALVPGLEREAWKSGMARDI